MPTLTLTLTTQQSFPLLGDAFLHNWTITSPWGTAASEAVATSAAPGDWTLTVNSLSSAPLGGGLYTWTLGITVTGPDWYNGLLPGVAGAVAQPLPWPYFGVNCNVAPGGGSLSRGTLTRMCADADGLVAAETARGGVGGIYPRPSGIVQYTQDGLEIDWAYNAVSTSGAPIAMVYWPAIDYSLLAFTGAMLGNGQPVQIGATQHETLVDFRTHGRYAIAIDTLGFIATSYAWAFGYMPSNPCELPNGTVCQQVGNGTLPEICFDLPAISGDNDFGFLFFSPPRSDARDDRSPVPHYNAGNGTQTGLRVTAAMRAGRSGRLWWLFQDCSGALGTWGWSLAYSNDGARTFVFPTNPVWGPDIRMCDLCITPDQGAVSVGVSYDQGSGLKQLLFKRTADPLTWPSDSAATEIRGGGFEPVLLSNLSNWRIFQRIVANKAQLVATNAENLLFTSNDMGRTWASVTVNIFDAPMVTCDMVPTADGGAIAAGTYVPPNAFFSAGGSSYAELRIKRCSDNALSDWPSEYVSIPEPAVGYAPAGGSYQMMNFRLLHRVFCGAGQSLLLPTYGYGCYISQDFGRTWLPNT